MNLRRTGAKQSFAKHPLFLNLLLMFEIQQLPSRPTFMLERQRLHISPLSPDLLPIILPADILERATNISFHTLQTFPDRNYGYVDLPIVDAEKVKKKFHGSILKGSAMRVEVARSEKARNTAEEDGVESQRDSNPEAKKKGKRKANQADEVISGFELPAGRKVKRGWAEPATTARGSKASKSAVETGKKKSSKTKSAYSDGPECLFKTKLPVNALGLGNFPFADGKARKRKRGESHRDVLVHEFSNTTKHATFLKESQGDTGKKNAFEYIDGKGWVDEDGNTVESEPSTRRIRSASGKGKISQQSDGSDEIALSAEGGMEEMPSLQPITTGTEEQNHETSSSEVSSGSENESEGDEYSNPSSESDEDQNSKESDKNSPMDDDANSPIQAISVSHTPPAPEVHPLEALFKRPKAAASSTPKKPTLELSTSFTFFDESPNGEPEENPVFLMPQTPFTQQDFRARRQRSAAPTPDTAAPGKTFGDVWNGGNPSDESDDNDDDDKDEKKEGNLEPKSPRTQSESPSPERRAEPESTAGANAPETEFQKWFWEHRGENNRAWKRRKREAAREKRKEDNKNRVLNRNSRTRTRM